LGALATGIFASKAVNPAGNDGLLFGNYNLFFVQLISVLVVWAFSFIMTIIISKLLDKSIGLAVTYEEETVGLDISQHGEEAYSGI
jgi:Amt family ammonium transporter